MLQNRGGYHSHLQLTSIRITNIHDPKDKKQAQTENTLGWNRACILVFSSCSSLFLDLGSQVISNMTHGIYWIFHNDGDVWRHGQGDSGTQSCCLGEEGEVSQGEVQLDRFFHVYHDCVIVLVHRGVMLQHYVSSSQVSLRGKSNAFLGDRYGA